MKFAEPTVQDKRVARDGMQLLWKEISGSLDCNSLSMLFMGRNFPFGKIEEVVGWNST